MSQKKQRDAGRGCLAIVMLMIVGGMSSACRSSDTSTSQPVPPPSAAAVASPSSGGAATPSPAHTHRPHHHRAAVTPSPVHTRRHTHRHVTPSKTGSAPRSACHPLTNSGKCYEPGEFCRNSDHGVSGVAGNGENIRCEDNNGWRWEPA